MLMVYYFISFIGGSFHLLIDPTLELIRITEKLLQVEGIGQLGPAMHGSLMKGIAAAQQLKDKNPCESPVCTTKKMISLTDRTVTVWKGTYTYIKEGAGRTWELTASRRVATSSMA
jgi:hypothetical protein